jgi:hypothetical protein
MNHSPRPWTVEGNRVFANGRPFAFVNQSPNAATREDWANARLIAAAPEMLAALLDALPYVEDVLADPEQLACFKPGIVQAHAAAIRAAILKATGDKSTGGIA